jgi:replicative DNA helicase
VPLLPIRDFIKDAQQQKQVLRERKEFIIGWPTGFTALDRLTQGLRPSEVSIIASSQPMAASSLALNIALHAATIDRCGVAIISSNNSKEYLVDRFISLGSFVNLYKVRAGFFDDEEGKRIDRCYRILSDAPIYIDDSQYVDMDEIKARILKVSSQDNISMVIFDYYLLPGFPGQDVTAINELTESIKELAQELEVHIIVIKKFSIQQDSRNNNSSASNNLAKSRVNYQDIDNVFFVNIGDREDGVNEERFSISEVLIDKNKNGPVGVAHLQFKHSTGHFDNISGY